VSDVFGKRGGESLERVFATPVNSSETRTASAFEYLHAAFHVSALPPLRYFRVYIGEQPLMALVDSGSSRTIFGDEGIEIVRRLNLPTERTADFRIRTANGQIAKVAEEVKLMLTLEGRRREVAVCLLPSLAVSCIVGMDFLCAFDIGLDFASSGWYFASRPWERRAFEPFNNCDAYACCGLSELTSDQESRLQEFLDSQLSRAVSDPGVTSLAEHRIDVGQHPPVKQRCYLVSPKVREAIHAEVDKMLAAGIIEASFSEWSSPS